VKIPSKYAKLTLTFKGGMKMKEEELLEILKKHGPLTRDQLAKITGLPRTTIYDKLSKLLLQKKVIKKPEERKKRGRPKIYWEAV